MHRTTCGDEAGGFPAQGTGIDQFSGDADCDFFGGYSFDRGANGGMDPGDGFFRNAAFSQLLIHSGSFSPGSDDTYISEIAPENLILDFQIEAVTVGHDDNIVFSGKLQIIRNLGVVSHDDLLRSGGILPAAVFGPFFKNGDPETHGMQQRCQSLSAVTAAEEDDPLADATRQAENTPALQWLKEETHDNCK